MKLFLGIIIGVFLATGVFYFITKNVKPKNITAPLPNPDSSKPAPMPMNEPKPENEENKLIIKPFATVTFLLSGNNEIYYYKGNFDGNLQKTDFTKVRVLIKKYNAEINSDDLMFIIKSDKGSTFKNAIDILDEMTINDVKPGHYAETEITEAENTSINILKKTKNG